MVSPFKKFTAGLRAAQIEFNETMDELRAFSEVLAFKQNSLEMDENGLFYVIASGTLEEVIETLKKQQEKLNRIKQQKDNNAR